jgi:hypothetical protein
MGPLLCLFRSLPSYVEVYAKERTGRIQARTDPDTNRGGPRAGEGERRYPRSQTQAERRQSIAGKPSANRHSAFIQCEP